MLDQQLRELAVRQHFTGPFLSLYIDTNRSDEQQRDRIRVWMKDEARRIREDLGGNGHKNRDVESEIGRIQSYLEESLKPETRGLAVFTCPSEDLFLPLQLPVPVQPHLSIGSRPHLRPLMELKYNYPPVVVVLVDAKSARVFEMEFGQVLFELDHEHPDMPRRHDQGGWSQANMQRHVDEHVNRHHKDVAEMLSRLIDQNRVRAVVLSGQERNVANFRQFLPKRVEERVAGTLHLDIRSAAEEITRAAQEVVHRAQQKTAIEKLQFVEEAGQKNGRGALGIDGVVDAANQRRLESLFMTSTAHAQGWRCTKCGVLGHEIPLGCPVCGGTVVTLDLVEELISAAEREDAKVEFVASGTLLDRYDGLGAHLRF